MPKLLQINVTLGSGSTGRIAEQIAEKAKAHGWDCFMAHGGRYVGKSDFKAIQVSSRFDNYIHAIEGEFLGLHGLGSYFSTRRFVKKVKEIKPDVVHLHNIHGYYINYKVLFEFLAESQIPLVWTLHDCWSFTGHCTHFENGGCEKWKTECGKCPLMMAQYKSRLIDRSRKNFLLKKSLYERLSNVTIVPVSNWLENYVSQSILGIFPIHVIHNGIDINVFTPTKDNVRKRYGISKDKTLVLGVLGSGFDVEKGRREFVQLASDESVQIILIGLTDKDKEGLPESIIKLGRTRSQKELAEYYRAADVLLNPTYNDTFPTVNLESIACGTPVVTYRTGGSPEAIDEHSGIVVEKGDYDGIVAAINEIKQKGKTSYGVACRERAEKYFNKDERFEEYVRLYEKNVLK